MEWVLEPSGDLVVKSKLSPHSGVAALRQLNPIHKEAKKFFLVTGNLYWKNSIETIMLFKQNGSNSVQQSRVALMV